MFRTFTSALIPRILRFRKEVVLLWHAFRAPETPLYLKVATALVALYLVSPFDLIPEFLPLLGFVDDLILVPMMVSWIVSRLPQRQRAHANTGRTRRDSRDGPTIDGTARRM
jgi:uncharacterized membrane protein YkvA (DUF1232 family)